MSGIEKLRKRFSADEAFDPSHGLGELTLNDLRDYFSDGTVEQFIRLNVEPGEKFDRVTSELSPEDRIVATLLYLMRLLQDAVVKDDNTEEQVAASTAN